MCNHLYSFTTSPEAIRQSTRALRDILGNLLSTTWRADDCPDEVRE